MPKSKLLLSIFSLFTLIAACNSPYVDNFNQTTQLESKVSSLTLQNKITPSLLNIIKLPDVEAKLDTTQTQNNQPIVVEYVNHFMFFSEIDKTGSAIEEILAHDGYSNAAKYVANWRSLLAENADWPDKFSTTHTGKYTALEHGQMKNGTGWFSYLSAAQKAEEYFPKALKAWHKGLPPDAPEQKEAWEWLSRTAHFIQDTTLPFHAVDLAQVGQLQHSPFEHSVSANFGKFFPSKNYDGGAWNGTGPYPSGDKKWGNYFDNKQVGEVIKENANLVRGLYKIVNSKADENNGNWDKVQSLSVPLASKTCAGLIVYFFQQVGETP